MHLTVRLLGRAKPLLSPRLLGEILKIAIGPKRVPGLRRQLVAASIALEREGKEAVRFIRVTHVKRHNHALLGSPSQNPGISQIRITSGQASLEWDQRSVAEGSPELLQRNSLNEASDLVEEQHEFTKDHLSQSP